MNGFASDSFSLLFSGKRKLAKAAKKRGE